MEIKLPDSGNMLEFTSDNSFQTLDYRAIIDDLKNVNIFSLNFPTYILISKMLVMGQQIEAIMVLTQLHYTMLHKQSH